MATEKTALETLLAASEKRDWFAKTGPQGKLAVGENGIWDLDVKLDVVRKLLTKALKPERQLIDIVSFKDGAIEEVTRTRFDAEPASPEPDKGVTIAKPTLGCPEPRLARAELRAREVLFAFLTPEQQEDFTKRNAFVSVGGASGHRYMVTSRHARDELAVSRRQLYDLDERRPYCVHDYSVPAAEEMLALHLMLQLPEHEPYLRHLE